MTDTEWPERLRLRDAKVHDDLGGAGQRIFTTSGQGYEKKVYIRADLVHAEIEQMKMQNAMAYSAGWDAAKNENNTTTKEPEA